MIIQMPSPGPLVGGGHLSAPGQLAIGEPRPRRWLSWSAGALAAMLIVLAAMALDDHLRPPRSLAGAVLTGPRGPACVRVVVAPDMSGTMTEYAAARRAAMAQLIPWAATQLRDTDEIAVVPWASTAEVSLPPTAVTAATVPSRYAAVGDDTNMVPLIDAISGLPEGRCRVLLALIGDGQVHDIPQASRLARLAEAGVDRMALLMPDAGMRTPTEFSDGFPWAASRAFDGLDPDSTAMALAHEVASAVGQTITRGDPDAAR